MWTAQELSEHHEGEWAKLAPEMQQKAIDYLKENLPAQLLGEVAEAYKSSPLDWMSEIHEEVPFYTFHFGEGMGIRNLLRDIILDKDLPSGNWDDYYVPALERAAGCR